MKKLLSNSLKCVVIVVALIFLAEGIAQAHLYGVAPDECECECFEFGCNLVQDECLMSRLVQEADYVATVLPLTGEDINLDGTFDTGEDIDQDRRLDCGEDLNCNGILDPCEDRDGDGVLDLTEDLNGNGAFDPGEDLDGDGNFDQVNEDVDGDGVLDRTEDLNGNGVFDPGEDIDLDGNFDDIDEDINANGVWDIPVVAGDLNGDGDVDDNFTVCIWMRNYWSWKKCEPCDCLTCEDDNVDGSFPTPCVSTLYLIDPNTGDTDRIGHIRNITGDDDEGTVYYKQVTGLDFDPISNKLFGVGIRCGDGDDGGLRLITINPCTAEVVDEEEIDGDIDPEDTYFRGITDISFQSDGKLFAFYLEYDMGVRKGFLSTINTSNGDVDNVDDDAGLDDQAGNGIAFSLNDILYHSGTELEGPNPPPVYPLNADLNELDPNDGDSDKVEDLNFLPPIDPTVDFARINAMDTQPGTGKLFAAVNLFDPGYKYWHPYQNRGPNVLAIVDTSSGDVTTIDLTIDGLSAIAFAPLPVADGGPDQTVEQCCLEGATVCLDAARSKNPVSCCGYPLIYTWILDGDPNVVLYGATPCYVFPLGIHKLDLIVDNCNGTDIDPNITVTVQDTKKPIITCLPEIVVEQESHAGTLVDPNLPAVYDICDPNVTVTGIVDPNIPLPYVFPLGTSTITWTATDASENTATCTQSVTVVDTTPPAITSVTATPNTLFPSMCGLLKEITVQVDANDICDSAPTCKIISVSSNQTGSRFFTEPDWFITGANTVLLRAKKDLFTLDNRIYTILVKCTDVSGNSSTAVATVEVGYMLTDFSFPTRRTDRRIPRRSRR